MNRQTHTHIKKTKFQEYKIVWWKNNNTNNNNK